MTLYRETPCEHGQIDEHYYPAYHDETMKCPGGFREEVTIDYEAATQALAITHVTAAQLARFVVDAALHTEKETASTVGGQP